MNPGIKKLIAASGIDVFVVCEKSKYIGKKKKKHENEWMCNNSISGGDCYGETWCSDYVSGPTGHRGSKFITRCDHNDGLCTNCEIVQICGCCYHMNGLGSKVICIGCNESITEEAFDTFNHTNKIECVCDFCKKMLRKGGYMKCSFCDNIFCGEYGCGSHRFDLSLPGDKYKTSGNIIACVTCVTKQCDE
jgi:hypothetical protein